MTPITDFFSQRQRFAELLWPTISVILVLVLTGAVLIPQIQGLVADITERATKREALAALQEKWTTLGSLDPQELRTRVGRLTEALPPGEDVGYFISSVRQAAAAGGVVFTGVEVLGQPSRVVVDREGPATVGRSRRVVIEEEEGAIQLLVTVVGGLGDLSAFLLELQDSLPLSTLQDFTAVRAGSAEEVTARLTLTYYYAAPPESIGRAEEPLAVITDADYDIYFKIENLNSLEVQTLPRVPTGNTQFMSPL